MSNIQDHAEEQAEKLAHTYPADTILCSIEATDEDAINAIRGWIKEKNLTADEVSLRKSETSVYVIAKRGVEIG